MSCWTDAAWNEAHAPRTVVLFHHETNVKAAAIPHTCTTCRGSIRVGEPYLRIVGMNRGDLAPYVVKECENC